MENSSAGLHTAAKTSFKHLASCQSVLLSQTKEILYKGKDQIA